jgi:glyoxylase-like metal-dependent hydrolase (beta-lactamase superfamily II)
LIEKFHSFTFPPVIPRQRDCILSGEESRRMPPDLGIDGILLYNPGHSSDHVSLLMDDGTLYCGEAFMNAGWSNFLGKKYYPVYA